MDIGAIGIRTSYRRSATSAPARRPRSPKRSGMARGGWARFSSRPRRSPDSGGDIDVGRRERHPHTTRDSPAIGSVPRSSWLPRWRASSTPTRCATKAVARDHAKLYLGLRNYTKNLLEFGFTARFVARATRRYFFASGPPAPENDGGLFTVQPNPATVHGGWGVPARRRASRIAAAGAGLGLAAA
jgi:hypothetical protein